MIARHYLALAVVPALAASGLLLASTGCNRRNALFEAPSAPASPPNMLSGEQPGVYSLTVQPTATLGQRSVQGTLVLTSAAPAGGTNVSLSSSDPALLSLPSTVSVPSGSRSTQFQATAQVVPADGPVTLTAVAAAGRPATATVSLWATLPAFFSFWSEPGDYIGKGGVRRLVPPAVTFEADCSDNWIEIEAHAGAWPSWTARLQATSGMPMRVGTYENATRDIPNGNPHLDVYGEGRGCSVVTGRFVVNEAVFTASGQVLQFWVTFEQHCGGPGAPALYGDVRVTNPPKPPYPLNLGPCRLQ